MVLPGHTRVAFSGTFDQGGKTWEIWSFGLSVLSNSGNAGLDDATRHGVEQACVSWFANDSANLISSMCTLRTVKVNQIGPNGKYTDAVVHSLDTTTPGAGGGGLAVPLQCAVAVSLETGMRGASRRGRFYLPPLSANVAFGQNGRLGATTTDNLSTSAKNLLNAIRAAGAQPIVASSKGYATPVTGVRVGDVIDTLRSRRNALLETYTHQGL